MAGVAGHRLVGEDSGRRVIEASTRAVDKAATLMRQMLAFGRTQPLNPRPIDLHDFVLRCEDLMGRAVGARVRLTADIEPGLPPVMADPTQFELALLLDDLVVDLQVAVRAKRA